MNASHAVRETYADKKSDNDQLSCDGTFDVQSVSPADYQHKARTTDRGIIVNLASVLQGISITCLQMPVIVGSVNSCLLTELDI